jgi:biopolymer transport protein ExbD
LTKDGRIYLNSDEIPRAALRDRLVAAMAGRERTLQFRGDAQVSYGLVIEVMDTLKAAGIETVGMITERPTRGPRP